MNKKLTDKISEAKKLSVLAYSKKSLLSLNFSVPPQAYTPAFIFRFERDFVHYLFEGGETNLINAFIKNTSFTNTDVFWVCLWDECVDFIKREGLSDAIALQKYYQNEYKKAEARYYEQTIVFIDGLVLSDWGKNVEAENPSLYLRLLFFLTHYDIKRFERIIESSDLEEKIRNNHPDYDDYIKWSKSSSDCLVLLGSRINTIQEVLTFHSGILVPSANNGFFWQVQKWGDLTSEQKENLTSNTSKRGAKEVVPQEWVDKIVSPLIEDKSDNKFIHQKDKRWIGNANVNRILKYIQDEYPDMAKKITSRQMKEKIKETLPEDMK